MARSLYKSFLLTNITYKNIMRFWKKGKKEYIKIFCFKDSMHAAYLNVRLGFSYYHILKKRFYIFYVFRQFVGMLFGELPHVITAGGFRNSVDKKKREKWHKDVQKFKKKSLHLKREAARLSRKALKEDRSAKRRKRRKK